MVLVVIVMLILGGRFIAVVDHLNHQTPMKTSIRRTAYWLFCLFAVSFAAM